MSANMCVSASMYVSWAFPLALFLIVFYYSHLFLICLIVFYYYSLDDCFLVRDRKTMDPDGRGGEEELGGESVIRVYCMGKIYFQ